MRLEGDATPEKLPDGAIDQFVPAIPVGHAILDGGNDQPHTILTCPAESVDHIAEIQTVRDLRSLRDHGQAVRLVSASRRGKLGTGVIDGEAVEVCQWSTPIGVGN